MWVLWFFTLNLGTQNLHPHEEWFGHQKTELVRTSESKKEQEQNEVLLAIFSVKYTINDRNQSPIK